MRLTNLSDAHADTGYTSPDPHSGRVIEELKMHDKRVYNRALSDFMYAILTQSPLDTRYTALKIQLGEIYDRLAR